MKYLTWLKIRAEKAIPLLSEKPIVRERMHGLTTKPVQVCDDEDPEDPPYENVYYGSTTYYFL